MCPRFINTAVGFNPSFTNFILTTKYFFDMDYSDDNRGGKRRADYDDEFDGPNPRRTALVSEREQFLAQRGTNSGGSGLQPDYRQGASSNASGRRYTQLPADQKALIKKGIYWRGRVPDGILSRLDTDARIMMFSWRKSKKQQRDRGSYGRRTGYAARSVARPGYITNFSQQQTPIIAWA